MASRQFPTNYWVWAFAAGCVFVALGFVNHLEGATWKGEFSLWHLFGRLVRHDYACSTTDMLLPVLCWGLFLTVPAIVIGWVLHAFVVILWSVVSGKSGAPLHEENGVAPGNPDTSGELKPSSS
jgi:hypothetical protein